MTGELPAGFGHAGNHTLQGHFTEGETGHLETTEEGATTTGDTATVREACRAGIAGEQGQTDVVSGSLEFGAEFRIFLDSFSLALFALEPASFSHRGAESASRTFFRKGKFSLAGRLNHAICPPLCLPEWSSPPAFSSSESSSSPTS